MNDLEQAFNSKDFKKVLELTKGKKEIVFTIYRLSALMALGKYSAAMSFLIENRDELFKTDPMKTIKANFSLRFALKQFDEAYEDIEAFNDYPYVSQEIEEELRGLHKRIRRAEKDSLREENAAKINLSLDQSESELLKNLDLINDKDIASNLPEIRKIVSSLGKDSARTYALMLLVAANDEKEIKFIKNDSEFDVIPSELEKPFFGDTHLRFVNKVQEECKDPSLADVALSLYSNAYISAYPEPLIEERKINDYVAAFKEIAMEYLRQENNEPTKIDANVLERIRKFLEAAE